MTRVCRAHRGDSALDHDPFRAWTVGERDPHNVPCPRNELVSIRSCIHPSRSAGSTHRGAGPRRPTAHPRLGYIQVLATVRG